MNAVVQMVVGADGVDVLWHKGRVIRGGVLISEFIVPDSKFIYSLSSRIQVHGSRFRVSFFTIPEVPSL